MKSKKATGFASAILLCAAIGLCQPAQAGFVTGMVVGGLLASGSHAASKIVESKDASAGVLAISDNHDLVFCRTDVVKHPGMCRTTGTFFSVSWEKPAEFAKEQGYEKVISQGVAASGGTEYIVILVEKPEKRP